MNDIKTLKCMDNVKNIVSKYNLKLIELPNGYKNVYQYLREYPEEKIKYESKKDDMYFIKKYKNRISQGHYGFSLGTPIIPEWNELIDEVLEYLISIDDTFEIQQIKIKFGGVRFYVTSSKIFDLYTMENYIENLLYDKNLTY